MRKLMGNIAATGAVNTKTLRAAKSGSRQASTGAATASTKQARTKTKASMAGYEGGRSTYVKTNDTGYGAVRDVRSKGQPKLDIPHQDSLELSGKSSRPRVTNDSPNQYNPFKADAQLAKMIR